MRYLKTIFTIFALVALGYTLVASLPAQAAIGDKCTKGQKTLCILNRDIGCDPAQPLNQGGCGIPHFITLVQVVIGFLQIIIIPLAVGFIVYGGFVIMTARGDPNQVKKGREIITAAVIGIVISLGAYIMITALNFLIVEQPEKGIRQFK